jgi:hypothetical protein
MSETVVRPRQGEQLPRPDDLVREIHDTAVGLYRGYKHGDRLRCDYTKAQGIEGLEGDCMLTGGSNGTTRITRTSSLGLQVGVLSPTDSPRRWVANDSGIGTPDTSTEGVVAWMAGELTHFKEVMRQPGVCTVIPAEE